MTSPALQAGDFVWCAFPTREAPTLPGPLHVGYAAALAAAGRGFGVIVAYTTSRPWHGAPPPGVIVFGVAEAAGLGQSRAFVIDLRRIAYLPLTATWFPRVEDVGCGVLGRASGKLRAKLNATLADLARRRPETLSRSGPLWGPQA